MRFRTREYQSDPSSCSWVVIGPAVPNPTGSMPTKQERVPALPPVEVMSGATTVLTAQGSLLRVKTRHAPDGCAPLRPDGDCDGGGSGENTSRARAA